MSGKQPARASTKYSPEADAAKTVPLTLREEDVLELAAQGKRSDEIALLLGASKRTIEKHLQNIFEKLRVETRGSAIQVYWERAIETLTLAVKELTRIKEEQVQTIAELRRLAQRPPENPSDPA